MSLGFFFFFLAAAAAGGGGDAAVRLSPLRFNTILYTLSASSVGNTPYSTHLIPDLIG